VDGIGIDIYVKDLVYSVHNRDYFYNLSQDMELIALSRRVLITGCTCTTALIDNNNLIVMMNDGELQWEIVHYNKFFCSIFDFNEEMLKKMTGEVNILFHKEKVIIYDCFIVHNDSWYLCHHSFLLGQIPSMQSRKCSSNIN
jgi:hypothetical protein